MLLSARCPITTLYHVEISGWDATHAFFVEKSELEWNDETGKHVLLKHALPEGAMIFVRLLQSASPERAVPVAYEAKLTGQVQDGRHAFALKQARSRGDGYGELVQ